MEITIGVCSGHLLQNGICLLKSLFFSVDVDGFLSNVSHWIGDFFWTNQIAMMFIGTEYACLLRSLDEDAVRIFILIAELIWNKERESSVIAVWVIEDNTWYVAAGCIFHLVHIWYVRFSNAKVWMLSLNGGDGLREW